MKKITFAIIAVLLSLSVYADPTFMDAKSCGQTIAQTPQQILEQLINHTKLKQVTCPDGGICADKPNIVYQGCCKLPTGSGYSCSSYKTPVCCPDGVHSCPSGYACTAPYNTCVPNPT